MKEPSGESGLDPGGGSRLLVRDPRSKVSSCSLSLLPVLLQWLSLGKSPGLRGENRRM